MKRKLIKQAGQALTVTIPIEWIRNNGLKAGDEIDLELHGPNLLMKSSQKETESITTINITDLDYRLKFVHINAAYAKGINQVEVDAEKGYYPDLKQNMGYAVVEQKGKHFTIRDISGTTTENLDNIFKRVFQMILRFYDSAIKDVFGENKGTLESINAFDAEINTFSLFLQRSIMKHSYPDTNAGKIMFAYSYALEKLGDEVLRFWRTDIEKKVFMTEAIKEIIFLSKNMLEKAFAVYYNTKSEKIEEMMKLKALIRKKASKLPSLDAHASKLIMHGVRIAEDSFDMIHLALMKKTEPKETPALSR